MRAMRDLQFVRFILLEIKLKKEKWIEKPGHYIANRVWLVKYVPYVYGIGKRTKLSQSMLEMLMGAQCCNYTFIIIHFVVCEIIARLATHTINQVWSFSSSRSSTLLLLLLVFFSLDRDQMDEFSLQKLKMPCCHHSSEWLQLLCNCVIRIHYAYTMTRSEIYVCTVYAHMLRFDRRRCYYFTVHI